MNKRALLSLLLIISLLALTTCGKSEVNISKDEKIVKVNEIELHMNKEKELDAIILNTLNNIIDLVCDVNQKIEDIVSYSKIDYNSEIKKSRLIEIETELSKNKKLLDELLKDYQCEFISNDDYIYFKEKYLLEINKLNLEKEELNKNKINSYNLDWINNFKKMEKLSYIDRNIVVSFIENIFLDIKNNIMMH